MSSAISWIGTSSPPCSHTISALHQLLASVRAARLTYFSPLLFSSPAPRDRSSSPSSLRTRVRPISLVSATGLAHAQVAPTAVLTDRFPPVLRRTFRFGSDHTGVVLFSHPGTSVSRVAPLETIVGGDCRADRPLLTVSPPVGPQQTTSRRCVRPSSERLPDCSPSLRSEASRVRTLFCSSLGPPPV